MNVQTKQRQSGTMGGNLHGQLGDGTKVDSPAFVRMNSTWNNTLTPVLIQTGVGYHTVVMVGVCWPASTGEGHVSKFQFPFQTFII